MDGRDKFVDAEEYRKVVASLLSDWAREEYRSTREIYRTWPRLLGHPKDHDLSRLAIVEDPHGSRAGILKVGKNVQKRKFSWEQSEGGKDDKQDDNKQRERIPSREGDEEDTDYAKLMKVAQAPEEIPTLPIPEIDNVPKEVVEGILGFRKRCQLCVNCIKDKGFRIIPCLALEAVKEWDAQLGGVDGETVAALAAKLNEPVSGHGMRLGKGLRCGACRACRLKAKGQYCLTTAAIREGRLPDRLKPAVLDAPRRRETFGSVSDPLSKKPSGLQILKHQYQNQDNSRKAEEQEEESDEEYERWGIPNVPYDERPTVSVIINQRVKRTKIPRWECFNRLEDTTICGSKNPDRQRFCPKCKAPRWSGPQGQLRERVFEILSRGLPPVCKAGELPVTIQRQIMREYGDVDEKYGLDERNAPVEDIKRFVDEYWSMQLEPLEPLMEKDPVVIQAGKILKHSKLGSSIDEFDGCLMRFIEEREAQMQGTNHGDASQHEGEDNNDHYNVVLLTDERRQFCDTMIQDIESSLCVEQDGGSIDLNGKLKALRSCLYDWSGESSWFEGMRTAWSCHIARRQFTAIVKDSFPFTIKSMLAHFIHCHTRKLRGDSLGEGACAVCSVNHNIFLPHWRTNPALVKLSDSIHDVTPRVLDEQELSTEKYKHTITEAVHQELRYPIYRLVEQTLNEASLKDTSERIPFDIRPFPAWKFVESTKLASFPALPVSNNIWYDPSSKRNRDPRIAQCIPDGKKAPQEFIADVLGRKRTKSKKAKKSKKSKVESPRAMAFSPYVQDSQTMPSSRPETAEEETLTEEECEKISSTFPADVQLVLKAAKSLGMSTSGPFGVGRALQTRLRRDRVLCPAAHGDDTRRDDSENTIDDWGVASGRGSEQSIFKRDTPFALLLIAVGIFLTIGFQVGLGRVRQFMSGAHRKAGLGHRQPSVYAPVVPREETAQEYPTGWPDENEEHAMESSATVETKSGDVEEPYLPLRAPDAARAAEDEMKAQRKRYDDLKARVDFMDAKGTDGATGSYNDWDSLFSDDEAPRGMSVSEMKSRAEKSAEAASQAATFAHQASIAAQIASEATQEAQKAATRAIQASTKCQHALERKAGEAILESYRQAQKAEEEAEKNAQLAAQMAARSVMDEKSSSRAAQKAVKYQDLSRPHGFVNTAKAAQYEVRKVVLEVVHGFLYFGRAFLETVQDTGQMIIGKTKGLMLKSGQVDPSARNNTKA